MDRVDYTKGIPERFWAVDRLLRRHPELKGTFSLVQIGAPAASTSPPTANSTRSWTSWRKRSTGVTDKDPWRPIVFVNEHHEPWQVYALYRMAAVCVVSSLHDGMNLVAKEFVAARGRPAGRAGALAVHRRARELTDAVLVNPYAVDEFAEALCTALTMPPEEQERRMRRMRDR